MDICFSDVVKIKETALTKKLGLAGLEGIVFGETVPTKSSVEVDEVVGDCGTGKALYVQFEETELEERSSWFAEELVLLVERRSSGVSNIGKRIEEVYGEE